MKYIITLLITLVTLLLCSNASAQDRTHIMIASKASALSTNKVVLRTTLKKYTGKDRDEFENQIQEWEDIDTGEKWRVLAFYYEYAKKGGGVTQAKLNALRGKMSNTNTFYAFISPTVKENIDKMQAKRLKATAFKWDR